MFYFVTSSVFKKLAHFGEGLLSILIDRFIEFIYFPKLFKVTYHEFPFLNYELYLTYRIRKLES